MDKSDAFEMMDAIQPHICKVQVNPKMPPIREADGDVETR